MSGSNGTVDHSRPSVGPAVASNRRELRPPDRVRPEMGADSGPSSVEEIAWEPGYERASVEEFMAAVEVERARLLAAIDVARARRDRAATVAESSERDAELDDLARAAQAELDAIEQEVPALLQAIRTAAEDEAARVLAAALDDVERDRSTSPSSPWSRIETFPPRRGAHDGLTPGGSDVEPTDGR